MQNDFKSVVFAGGGSRCFWQVGFWEVVAPALGLRPEIIAGVSAGACMSAMAIFGDMHAATEFFLGQAERNEKNFYPEWILEGKRPLPHPAIFEGTIRAAFSNGALDKMRQGPEMRVLIARPPKFCGPVSGAMLGIIAYSLEKAINHPLHPQWPTKLGFTPEVVPAADCADIDDLVNLMTATCCTPPLLPPMYRQGRPVLDGGVIDNVPLAALGPDDGPALVLLTRRYKPEQLQGHNGRVYLQPSRPVPIKKWDYASPDLSLETLDQGRRDGELLLKHGPEVLQR